MQYKIIVDKQPSSNPSTEKKEYIVDIEELRVKGNVYDSLNIEMDRTYVTRRLSLSEYGVLSVLDEPVIQELTDLDIKLFEGDNYIYLMDMQGNKFYAEYLVKNDFNDIYATKNEMNSSIEQTAQSIELSVNQKLEGYSTTQEMNSAIEQTAQSITSSVSETYATKETTNQLSTRIKQTAKSIDLTATDNNTSAGITIRLKNEDGTQIDSKSANITMKGLVKFTDLSQSGSTTINGSNITTGTIDASKVTVKNLNASNITSGTISGRAISGGTITGTSITNGSNFSVNSSGTMTCKNANVSGTITSSNANITGGKIKVSGARSATDLLRVENSTSSSVFSYMQPIGAGFVNGGTDNAVYITAGDISGIDIYDNDGTTTLNGSGIRTPKVTQTSLESIKKNINKFNKNATNIINNSDIYEYNLKSDEDTDKKLIGFIIGDKYRTPDEVISRDGQAVGLYSAIGILWKGFQEQEKIIKQLQENDKQKDKLLAELILRVEQLKKEAQHE